MGHGGLTLGQSALEPGEALPSPWPISEKPVTWNVVRRRPVPGLIVNAALPLMLNSVWPPEMTATVAPENMTSRSPAGLTPVSPPAS